MTLLDKDWRGERGLSVNALRAELAVFQPDIDHHKAAKAAANEALQTANAKAARKVLEAILTLFEVAGAPEMVMMPIGRAGWARATEQKMLFSFARTAEKVECELPLHDLEILLAAPLKWAPDMVVTRESLLRPVFHPEGYSGFKEAGFILVTKDLVRKRVGDQWLAKPDPERLPYLPNISGNIPFVRAFAETSHGQKQKWGVFFPENRPMPEESLGKARYHHGWDFDTELETEAFALMLVRLVENTPADEVLALPESTVRLPAGLPLAHVFCCTDRVTHHAR